MVPIAQIVEDTVAGMGYELVDVAFAARGLLQVFIDRPEGVLIEDCERVSRQLVHVLMVEEADYQRLEVSSPGLDRPLKRAEHYERFVGEMIALKLHSPFEGRRSFKGILVREEGGGFAIDLIEDSEQSAKGSAARGSGKKKGRQEAVLTGRRMAFSLDEVERARLVPNVGFRSSK